MGHVEDHDDGDGHVLEEEVADAVARRVHGDHVGIDVGVSVGVGGVLTVTGVATAVLLNGPQADPELRDEHKRIEQEAEPGADDAALRREGELADAVAVGLPGLAEPDVRQADGPPGEDGRQPRNGEEPLQDVGLGLHVGQVCQ